MKKVPCSSSCSWFTDFISIPVAVTLSFKGGYQYKKVTTEQEDRGQLPSWELAVSSLPFDQKLLLMQQITYTQQIAGESVSRNIAHLSADLSLIRIIF